MMPEPLHSYFESRRKMVEAALEKHLRNSSTLPNTIHQAMRYSVFAGGKRLRPVLVIAAAECCGGTPAMVMPTACAMELIHTYSLVHDDLPAMDDDDLRRGQPTSHKVYGEAIAILAGDGLLTQAFELIGKNAKIRGVQSSQIPKVSEAVAEAAGTLGMIGGQVMDIQMEEGRWLQPEGPKETPIANAEKVLDYIHRHKTAALIQTSLVAGALLMNANKSKVRALERYGENIGLAFQITDDVLDVTADKVLLGKRGSDAKNKKLTYPAIYGLEASRAKARQRAAEAQRALKPLGSRAEILKQLADYVIEREN